MIALDMSFNRFPDSCRRSKTFRAGKNLWVWREVEQFLAAPEDEAAVLAERIRADCMEAMLEKQAERQSRPRNRRRPIRPA